MSIFKATKEAVAVVLYLLPPALALIVASPLLMSPFTNEYIGLDYVLLAAPVYLGIIAAPGYMYAFLDDLRTKKVGPRVRVWVRLSLILALIASVWGTGILFGALPFVLLPLSSSLTSALLLFRFEFGNSGSGKRAVMIQTAKEG